MCCWVDTFYNNNSTLFTVEFNNNVLGMYRIAILKIRPEPDSIGYQMNCPTGTGYLNTCCIAFFSFVCGMNKKVIPRDLPCLSFSSASEMTYIVSGEALKLLTHSLVVISFV